MDLKLAGKIVLITGSSRGIGLATAKAFAAEGCRIMLSARSAEQLRDAEAALRGSGVEVAAHVADVSDPAGAARLIEATLAAYGGIDILVNNVGGGGGGARIADSTDEDWRGALERNLIQTVRMMRLALPHMRGRAGSRGRQHRIDLRLVAAARDVGPIRCGQGGADFRHRALGTGVRAIRHPRQHRSPRARYWSRATVGTATASPIPSYFDDYVRHGFPMGRLGTAEEVADVIVFVASPRAHWINGRNIPVDGLEQPHAPLDRRPY